MMRYAGVKNNRICIISDDPWTSDEVLVIPVPEELSHIPSKDLILHSQIRNGQIVCKLLKKRAGQLKVALVGNWKMRCGIATYSENLWAEVVKHVGDYKLFIENNSSVTGSLTEIGGQQISPDKVSVCWKRGESLKELTDQIKEYDPDIVWIQHEFGLWSNAGHWLSLMNQLSRYRVIVTMHSVFHHKDKTIVEAAMPEIVVHLQGAYNVLKNEKHVPGKVYVIPHGCFPCTNKERLWNFYKSDKTFLQFGFGFRYKGWENAIRAVAVLKQKYPDVFFTGLFSESPHNTSEHQMYYNELMDLVESLGVQENVAIIRGFQSEETLDSYMRTNQATLFPYISHPAHEVYGASGAARVAMAKGLPVVTSSVNHFSDLPSIKADTAEEIAAALEELFTKPEMRERQIAKQIDYLNENTWEKVALRYISLFENG
jgi:glycosyltransferase involved in cell wall biosynthesis